MKQRYNCVLPLVGTDDCTDSPCYRAHVTRVIPASSAYLSSGCTIVPAAVNFLHGTVNVTVTGKVVGCLGNC